MSSAGISFGGLASGLDTKAIISALVAVEERPIRALETKKTSINKQKSLYGDLRREARPDAVSTIEAVALSLQVLEGDAAVREKLLEPFRALLEKARREGVRDSKRDRRVRR